jgi:hypothetical protein
MPSFILKGVVRQQMMLMMAFLLQSVYSYNHSPLSSLSVALVKEKHVAVLLLTFLVLLEASLLLLRPGADGRALEVCRCCHCKLGKESG